MQSELDDVVRSRKPVRAFRPDPVPRSRLVEILDVARASPSNFNSQPWRVYVLAGNAKRALGEAILLLRIRRHYSRHFPSLHHTAAASECMRIDPFIAFARRVSISRIG